MMGGEFATARRGISTGALRLAHDIAKRGGIQAAANASGIAMSDLRQHIVLPERERPTYVPARYPKDPLAVFNQALTLMSDEDMLVALRLMMEAIDERGEKGVHIKNARIREVIEEVAQRHDIPVGLIYAQDRRKAISTVRHEAYYLVHRDFGLSYPEVGRIFDRDHTTILHGVRKHEKRMAEGKA